MKTYVALSYSNRSTCTGDDSQFFFADDGNWFDRDQPQPRIDESALEGLKATFRGDVIGPDDPGYDDARRVQNGMIDRRPALIARPQTSPTSSRRVGFGRDAGPRHRGPQRRPQRARASGPSTTASSSTCRGCAASGSTRRADRTGRGRRTARRRRPRDPCRSAWRVPAGIVVHHRRRRADARRRAWAT